jgi:glucosyl-dolichyl phosphate glucuronosyltransferase
MIPDPPPAEEGSVRGMSMLSVSVVICAHTERRWDDTLAAVSSVRNQSYPAKEIIVVVDHNEPLYERLKSALPDVTVEENHEQQGLSGGKNTGTALASGQVVAFLDDDAVADRNWLLFMVSCYDEPGVVGVGGRTLPNWDSERPFWFPREFDWVVGCTYIGMPKSRAPIRNVMGGNASFKREIFEKVGGFKSGIGRAQGRRPLGCEETEFCIRMNQRLPNAVLLFDDKATIWHRVANERSKFAYFRSRCYAEGLSKAMVTRAVGANDALSSERRYATRTLTHGVIRGLADAMRGDRAGLGRAGAIVVGLACTTLGYAVGILSGVAQNDRHRKDNSAKYSVPEARQ